MRVDWKALLRHPLTWILLFAALLRWQAAGFMRSSDDLDYVFGARDLLTGKFNPESFHQLRLGMVLPIALSFAVFGFHHAAAVLWPMVSSLLSIAVIHRLAARRSSPQVAAGAALFLAASTQHVLSGAEVFPDSPMTFWILLALLLYLEEREGAGRALRYGLAGLCLYGALATRAEALKLFPVFAVFEAWFFRRRGPDWKVGWIAAGLVIPSLLELAFFGVLTGHPFERLRELTAVRECASDPGSQNMGLRVMLKSLISPFGAFGLLFPVAAFGAARALRQRRLGILLFLAAWLLATNLGMAYLYRIGDGRYYTLISPVIAWLAAEGIAAIPMPRLRMAAAAGLFLAGTLMFHVRLPPDTMAAYGKLDAVFGSSPGVVYSDQRTVHALEFYFTSHPAVVYGKKVPAPPGWVVDNARFRAIDKEMYGGDDYPGDLGRLEATIPLSHRGLPGFMPLARLLFGWKGAGAVDEIRVFRLDR